MIGIMNFNINSNSNYYKDILKKLDIKTSNNLQIDILENFYKFNILKNILNEIKTSELIIILIILNYTFIKIKQEYNNFNINNLTSDNLLIIHLNEEKNLKFEIDNKILKLKTKILVKLIDLENVNINNENTDNNININYNIFLKSLKLNNNDQNKFITDLLKESNLSNKLKFITQYIRNKISSNSIDMSDTYSQTSYNNSNINTDSNNINTESVSDFVGGNLSSSINDVFVTDYDATNNNPDNTNISDTVSFTKNLSTTSNISVLSGGSNKKNKDKLRKVKSIRYIGNSGSTMSESSIMLEENSKSNVKQSSKSSIANVLDVNPNELAGRPSIPAMGMPTTQQPMAQPMPPQMPRQAMPEVPMAPHMMKPSMSRPPMVPPSGPPMMGHNSHSVPQINQMSGIPTQQQMMQNHNMAAQLSPQMPASNYQITGQHGGDDNNNEDFFFE